MLLTSDKVHGVMNNRVRTSKPKFERKMIAPGQYVKVEVTEREQPAKRPKLETKVDKRFAEDKAESPEPDDFTVIKSVGVATARALVARGIRTFDDLMTARIDFLPSNVVEAIEAWRESRG